MASSAAPVASPRSIRSWLSNPFQYLAGGGALARAIGVFSAALLVGEVASKLTIGALLKAAV